MTPYNRRPIYVVAWVLLALQPSVAFAYFDPNAGGMLFQLLTPLFAAIAGTWLFCRRWIGAFIRSLWAKLTGKQEQ